MLKLLSKGFYNDSSFKSLSFLILFCVFIVYFNSLFNGFSLDDEFVTVTNATNYEIKHGVTPNNLIASKGFMGIKDAFTNSLQSYGVKTGAYRPFVTLTFCIEYGIWGVNPFFSHLVNLIIYLAIIFLVFKTIVNSFKINHFLSFWITLIFALHPSHTEIVNSLKGRDELLWFLFFVLSFRFYDRYLTIHQLREKTLTYLLFVFFFLIGLLSKTSIVLLFPLLVIYIFNKTKSFKIKHYIPALIIPIIYLLYVIIKKQFLIEHLQTRVYYFIENPLHNNSTLINKSIAIINTYGFYFKELIWPFKQLFYYGYNYLDITSPYTFYFGFGFFLFLFLAYLAYKKFKITVLFILLFTSISLFSNIVPVEGIVAERYLFLPSLFFSSILVSGINTGYLSFLKNYGVIFLCFITFSFSIYNINRNKDWKSKLSLFEADIKDLKNSAKANNLIANQYFESATKNFGTDKGNNHALKAKNYYRQSILVYPDYAQSYHNLGLIYLDFLQMPDSALFCFNRSISINPESGSSYFAKSSLFLKVNQADSALFYLKKSVNGSNPDYFGTIKILDQYFKENKREEMYGVLNHTEKQYNTDYEWIIRKANYFTLTGFFDSSMYYFEKSYFIKPSNELKNHIIENYQNKKMIDKSKLFQSKAVKIR